MSDNILHFTKYDHFWEDRDRVLGLLRCPLPCTPSELAGMLDGDGCFCINSQKSVECALTQCYFPLLQRLQQSLGGTLDKQDRKHRSEKQRFQYNLKFNGLEITAIVPIVKDHLVMKGARAERILKVLDFYQKTDKASTVRREELMRDKTDVYAFDRINKDYIRGLFCAEGCLRPNIISISQKSCTDLLRAMQAYIGAQMGRGPDFGTVNDTAWVLCRKAYIKAFLDWLTNNNTWRLFHEEKAGQVDAWYAWYQTGDAKHKAEMTKLKHIDYNVADADIKVANQEAREFSARLRSEAAGRTKMPTAAAAPPLTEEQREMARTLLRTTDTSLQDVATEVECTKEQVQHLKKTEDIERPNPKTVPEQLDPDTQRHVRELLFSKDKELSYAAIAKIARCNKGQVSTHAQLVNAPPRKPGRKPRSSGVEVMTEKPPKPTTGEKRKMAPRLTADQKAKLRRLLEENPADRKERMTLAEIAKDVGCTKGQVATNKLKWQKENEKEAEASAAS